MTTDLTYAYAADITKAERDPDGNLIVFGKAAGPDLDSDEQVCDAAWLQKAMPDWAEWSNIREMHQPICAGVGLVTTEEEGGSWTLKSMVLDAGTATKIENRGLRGYSVGIKNPRVVKDAAAPGGRIVGGDIVEISYVDRPCNPTAKLMICKAAGAGAALLPAEAPDRIPTPKDIAGLVTKVTTPAAPVEPAPTDPAPTGTETSPPPAGHVGDPTALTPSEDDGQVRAVLDDTSTATPPADDAPAPPAGDAAAEKLVQKLMAALQGQAGEKTPAATPQPDVVELGFHAALTALKADLRTNFAEAVNGAEALKRIRTETVRLGQSTVLSEHAKALLLKAADPGKDNGETHDSANLRAVLVGLVTCMKGELDELLHGENELSDLSTLLRTIQMFCGWWSAEAFGGETSALFNSDGEMTTYMDFAANPDGTPVVAPDLSKTATSPALADGTPGTVVDEPVESDRLTAAVKSVSADLMKAFEKRFAALEAVNETLKADLDKALALPEIGGPVVTRTGAQAALARQNDALHLADQAAELIRKADMATDPYLSKGYRDRAQRMLADAAA